MKRPMTLSVRSVFAQLRPGQPLWIAGQRRRSHLHTSLGLAQVMEDKELVAILRSVDRKVADKEERVTNRQTLWLGFGATHGRHCKT